MDLDARPYRRRTIRVINLRGDMVRIYKDEDGKVRILLQGNIPIIPDVYIDPVVVNNVAVHVTGVMDVYRTGIADAINQTVKANVWALRQGRYQ